MTSRIPGLKSHRSLDIVGGVKEGVVLLRLHNDPEGPRHITVDRADLLGAVRTELGVLTIDGGQEPLAQWELELLGTTDAARLTADHAEALAVHYAILAAEKRKSPPVDEQQVEALASVLETATDWDTNQQRDAVARHLVQAGYKKTVQS